MRKTIFYISILIAFLLLVNVLEILITYFERLTKFGFGYLTGKIVLFMVFALIAYFTREKKIKAAAIKNE
ncbi:hypothetical protein [Algibacter sp. L4_22]|uniref:hypothetical protein n=1 Tax=Algibacter sp. L4_22 TaxID=2942477 RepID=UPI00201B765E|nr:hypothetical protein [Algibacter sp. L4_22]MCL5126937.1 hypothetical protein [Algibacter sp. L4_22]